MRVEANPLRLSAIPGEPSVITVNVTNTRTVISGHRLRVLGIDPAWATLDQENLSLFPETSGVAVVTVTFPVGIPAGVRHLSIEITELTPPAEVAVIDVELTVPAQLGVGITLDPASVTGGKAATSAVLVENTGNATQEVALSGIDEEGEVEFVFDPAVPVLGPGEQALSSLELRSRRPWFGSPKIRSFTVNAGPTQAPVMAFGVWVQKPRLSRGALALMGLVAAITVFAIVITASLSQVVNTSNADRDLAIAVAQAAATSSNTGTASISGTVTLLSSGAPVGGVTVDLYQASNTANPLVSTATGATGGYTFAGLAAGSYKVLFKGAGFTELWYPASLTPDNATAVNLQAKQKVIGVNIRLGGVPASITGQVVGTDPAGATLTLQLPAAAGSPATVVTTQTLDASGAFTLSNIPSPSAYQLVVAKQGYATATQNIELAGGQNSTGVIITLHQGNGSIAGTVSTAAGPLGGATISASDGTSSQTTVSLTTAGQVGSFVLNSLATPASFTLLVSASGYATQTLSISLASGQHLTGVAVTLDTGVGSISGNVTTSDGAPAGGVTVTASNGQLTVTTVSLSVGQVGSYSITGLPVPNAYSVTFSRTDLASQTQAVSLGAVGGSNATGINASMVPSTSAIYGTVSDATGPLGEIAISLTSGTTTYAVTSASVPNLGAYEIDGIVPGTYTISFTRQGGLPTSSIVTLTAGQRLEDNPVLAPAASITGTVVQSNSPTQPPPPVPGTEVILYVASQYPTVVTATTLTNANGTFTFNNVDAPQNYIVAFAYPQGSASQVTYTITTALGTQSQVCSSGSGTTCQPVAVST